MTPQAVQIESESTWLLTYSQPLQLQRIFSPDDIIRNASTPAGAGSAATHFAVISLTDSTSTSSALAAVEINRPRATMSIAVGFFGALLRAAPLLLYMRSMFLSLFPLW